MARFREKQFLQNRGQSTFYKIGNREMFPHERSRRKTSGSIGWDTISQIFVNSNQGNTNDSVDTTFAFNV